MQLGEYSWRCSLQIHNNKENRSAVEAWSKASPGVAKWTKATVAQHITVGGLGATSVGTPAQIADVIETWVEEADVDGFNFVRVPPEIIR